MFDTGIFVGGMIIGGVFMAIFVLALITAYCLWNSKETKEMDKIEKETKIKIKRVTHSSGGIRYNDGLDIERWL